MQESIFGVLFTFSKEKPSESKAPLGLSTVFNSRPGQCRARAAHPRRPAAPTRAALPQAQVLVFFLIEAVQLLLYAVSGNTMGQWGWDIGFQLSPFWKWFARIGASRPAVLPPHGRAQPLTPTRPPPATHPYSWPTA